MNKTCPIFTAPIALALILFPGVAANAQTTNGLSPAEIQGRQLAAEILSETPTTNFTQTGVIRIRGSEGPTTNIPITFTTSLAGSSWCVTYTAKFDNPPAVENLSITHQDGLPNRYNFDKDDKMDEGIRPMPILKQSQIMSPFAGSDFWIADLGLEFFHWPEQKIIGHESRRTRDCAELESDNPDPTAGSYSRVVTWIDNQTLGIIHAEAYDADNKLLKVFDPKSLKKVNGQWELQDIEIRNVQTRSRTRIRFDLNSKS